MLEDELTDPHHVTAGFIGQPGERVFHLQAQDDRTLVTLQCEKGQVGALGELLEQLLATLDDVPADDWDHEAMKLREPVQARWRVGEIAVGMDVDRGRFLMDATEFDPELSSADDTDGRLRSVRIWLSQDQARRLAAHATAVVGQGRPPGEQGPVVKDVAGQVVFPSTNGHGRLRH